MRAEFFFDRLTKEKIPLYTAAQMWYDINKKDNAEIRFGIPIGGEGMNEQITVMVNGRPVAAVAGMLLSEITHGERPCGGHGKCGKCRVVAHGHLSPPSEAERRLLSEAELARGVRLSCLTRVQGDCTVETNYAGQSTARIVTEGTARGIEIKPTFDRYGVAVDIGTTTLAARLYGADGKLLADVSRLNPQLQCGADVISRIEAALAGKADLLADLIRGALNEMLLELALAAHIDASEIDGVVITGNTVMLSLLVGASVEPFSHAPFDVERLFGEEMSACELSLTSLAPGTPVYPARCISAFVGADTVCAMLATGLCDRGTAMLADIGTNGEMALWHNGRLTVCSTAAGPAFEGVGISCGMRGAVGAIDRVAVVNGRLHAHVIGETEPIGICGSGLCDAAACMLDLELLDESGYLEDSPQVIQSPVALTQQDIRMLQLAKSAICAGLLTLAKSCSLQVTDVPVLYVAGGFGYYLNKRSAARIGLLPRALAEVSRAVGNAALDGAAMLLLNADQRVLCEKISSQAKMLELSTSPVFSEHYINGMMFGSQ